MATYKTLFPPIYSPWGPTQTATEELPGIWHVTTASHGGYILDHDRNEIIPAIARSLDAAYEEDCCWAIPACVFADEFKAADPNYPADAARRTLHDWMPEFFETITGSPPDPETSFKLLQRTRYDAARSKRIVISAQQLGMQQDGTKRLRIWTKTLLGLDDRDRPLFADDSESTDIDEQRYRPIGTFPMPLDQLLGDCANTATTATNQQD